MHDHKHNRDKHPACFALRPPPAGRWDAASSGSWTPERRSSSERRGRRHHQDPDGASCWRQRCYKTGVCVVQSRPSDRCTIICLWIIWLSDCVRAEKHLSITVPGWEIRRYFRRCSVTSPAVNSRRLLINTQRYWKIWDFITLNHVFYLDNTFDADGNDHSQPCSV